MTKFHLAMLLYKAYRSPKGKEVRHKITKKIKEKMKAKEAMTDYEKYKSHKRNPLVTALGMTMAPYSQILTNAATDYTNQKKGLPVFQQGRSVWDTPLSMNNVMGGKILKHVPLGMLGGAALGYGVGEGVQTATEAAEGWGNNQINQHKGLLEDDMIPKDLSEAATGKLHEGLSAGSSAIKNYADPKFTALMGASMGGIGGMMTGSVAGHRQFNKNLERYHMDKDNFSKEHQREKPLELQTYSPFGQRRLQALKKMNPDARFDDQEGKSYMHPFQKQSMVGERPLHTILGNMHKEAVEGHFTPEEFSKMDMYDLFRARGFKKRAMDMGMTAKQADDMWVQTLNREKDINAVEQHMFNYKPRRASSPCWDGDHDTKTQAIINQYRK